ncbi:Ribonuclease H superfamily protein [Pleurotus pulmonarius]
MSLSSSMHDSAGLTLFPGALDQLKKDRYMIMGADVGHPGPGTAERPSVTSLPPRQEIIVDLREKVAIAVSAFGEKNRGGPVAIVFFRDGVSEGEYSQVAENEIPAIQAGIDDAHHIRFFPKFPYDADEKGNCPAGLVVDTGIQSPFCTDFYLLSHSGVLGTSRPSHYIILKDEISTGISMVFSR